jgi:methylated-DNA-[protein]-cysteine S-methyltransferase
MSSGFTLFNTAIGLCAIAWGPNGVAGVQLPESSERETRARMRRRFPAAVEEAPAPPGVRRAIEGIVALLRGERNDLSTVVLDMSGVPAFHRDVYEVTRSIPPGSTLSYGEVAARAGAPGAARAVGQALGRNPFAIVVPCHRVLAAGGKVGGFSAEGGLTTKRRMLAIEGARIAGEGAKASGSLFDEGAKATGGRVGEGAKAAGGGARGGARAGGDRAKVSGHAAQRTPGRGR